MEINKSMQSLYAYNLTEEEATAMLPKQEEPQEPEED